MCFLCAAPVADAKYARLHHTHLTSQIRQLAVTAELCAIGVSPSAACYLARVEARKVTPIQVAWQQCHTILLARSFLATTSQFGAIVSDLRRGTRVKARVYTSLSGGLTFPSMGSVGTVVTRHADLSVLVLFEDGTVELLVCALTLL